MPRVRDTSSNCGTQDGSKRRLPRAKRALKTTRNIDTDISRRKRRRRSSMFKREAPFESLIRLPLATSPLCTETSSHDEEGEGEELTISPSTSLPERPISISSRSRTPSEASVVDLTNDSGMEDEGVVDLTTSFQIPAIDSTVPVSSAHGVTEVRRVEGATSAEVVEIQESDDDVMIVSLSHPHPHTNDLTRTSLSSTSLPTAQTATQSNSSSSSASSAINSPHKSSITCPICMDKATQFETLGRKLVSTVCGHVFCEVCLRNSISSLHKCPVCNRRLTLKQYHRLFLS